MGVESFSGGLREEADRIWSKVLEHPFLAEMAEGELPLDKFKFYVRQDYVYLVDFARCLGVAVAKAGDLETMRAVSSLLNGALTVEMDMLERLGEKLGIEPREFRASEAAPTNTAYTRHLLQVAYSGTLGEILASMLPCMWSYMDIGEMMGQKAKPHPIYTPWHSTYRSKEYRELMEWYRDLTDRLAKESGPKIREKMRGHFMLSTRYEYMFWEMAYRKEIWPP